jgi:hypothetical protein
VSGEDWPSVATSLQMASDDQDQAVIQIESDVQNRTVIGTLQQLAAKHLTLRTNEAIPESVAVTVLNRDLLHLGVVLHCVADRDNIWNVEVQVTRSIIVL